MSIKRLTVAEHMDLSRRLAGATIRELACVCEWLGGDRGPGEHCSKFASREMVMVSVPDRETA